MNFVAHAALRCPLDQLPLVQQGMCLQCGDGHSFDIARQGYANLLLAQDKRSKQPGDSRAMVSARREFLKQGYLQPLAEQLSLLLAKQLDDTSLLVDAGCGEGYYLQQFSRHLSLRQQTAPAMVGFDISKWAVQAAARTQAACWLVASNRHIPLADNSVDSVLSLFGFPVYASFQRLLRPGGYLLEVNPGPRHLLELRELLYSRVKAATETSRDRSPPAGFLEFERIEQTFSCHLPNPAAIGQLLQMTPHFFRASAEGKQRVAALGHLTLTLDVVIRVLRCQQGQARTTRQTATMA